MSFDLNRDAEDIEAAALRSWRAAPGLPRDRETGVRVEAATGNGAGDRAISELASENADLYRRNAEQGRAIEQLQARLDMSEARFRAWAKEMANREDARAARDAARDKREEALTGRIRELELGLADRAGGNDPGGPVGRVSGQENAQLESDRRERGRSKPSNEFIGVGVAVGVAAGAVAADPAPVNFLIGALGVVGAGIPWIRKLREASSGDRCRG